MENTTSKAKFEQYKNNGITLRRILIVQTAFIGDVVLAEPLIAQAKIAYPHARIDVVVIPAAANVLETHPAINELIVYDKRIRDSGIKGFCDILARIKKSAYDLAIVPHRSFRSALLIWLAGIPLRIGFENSAGHFLFNNKAPYSQEHEVVRDLSLLKPLGVDSHYQVPAIYTTNADERMIAELLPEFKTPVAAQNSGVATNNGKRESPLHPPRPPQGGDNRGIARKNIIALAPGSVWATKRWPERNFQALGRKLLEENRYCLILIGGEKDRELCARIAKNISGDCNNFAGRLSLRESVALLKKCAILISNDSAPTHLGIAAGCRVVTIFGATVPRFGFYPKGREHKIIEPHLDLACRPCGIHGRRKCPAGTFDCMHSISVEKVLSTIRSMLNDKSMAGKIRNIVHRATSKEVDLAVDSLKKNGVLLIPTETLYGLAANALSEVAVKRIFNLKHRTSSSPLPLICSSIHQVAEFCQLEGLAKKIAAFFWPGPLTLVLHAGPKLPGHIFAADGTVAVRVPSSTFCRDIASALGAPITATSANISGDKPVREINELPLSIINGVDLAFNAGVCPAKLPSAIIKISGNDIQVLRKGKISLREIHARIGVSPVE